MGDETMFESIDAASSRGGNDTIIIEGALHNRGGIWDNGGNDQATVANLNNGVVMLGAGEDTLTAGGLSDNVLIDCGKNDGDSDTLNLNGSGSLLISNFNSATDKLIINGSTQSVRGDGKYGNYDIAFLPDINIDTQIWAPTNGVILQGGTLRVAPELKAFIYGVELQSGTLVWIYCNLAV